MIIPVLTKVAIAKDSSSVTLKDSTGAYSGSNTGGYGAPNADEPLVIGIRARYWPEEEPYGGIVTSDNTLIAELLGAGHLFTPAAFGLTSDTFSVGVHHFKYYPMELQTTVANATKGSTLITISAGTAPSAWDIGYKGITFYDGTEFSKVYLIDRTKTITASSFYLTEEYEGDTDTDLVVWIGTEGDLKVFMDNPAQACLVDRIGKTGDMCHCNKDEDILLMEMTMMTFAAQANFDCADYHGAHNKITLVYIECSHCQTTCSCS